jgi:hypothetical protein
VVGVNLIPIILAQPTSQVVYPSQPVAFSVLAEGPVPLQYQWTFDGTNLPGATNSALIISNAQPSEAGTYAVTLGTEPNVTVSSNVMLSVVPANVIISLDEGDLIAALQGGGTVTFAISGTIVLTQTITITNDVILDGTGNSITISGGGAVQLFKLPAGLNLTLRNLTLANGLDNGDYYVFDNILAPGPAFGGAVYTLGNLDVESCTFANNSVISPGQPFDPGASTYGGAIYNGGWLTISNTLFVYNSANGGAG